MPRTGIFAETGGGRKDEDGMRVQGYLTSEGAKEFEKARQGLSKLYKRVCGKAPAVVSDADTIEYAVRGERATLKYLRSVRQQ